VRPATGWVLAQERRPDFASRSWCFPVAHQELAVGSDESLSVSLYAAAVFRRALASLALIAIVVSPAMTSTRLFCRFTGVEIIGCDESRVPTQTQLRNEDCCLKRTFHAIDPSRILADDGSRFAAPPAVAIVEITPEVQLLAAVPSAPVARFSDAGPPVFLTNRALLI